MKKGLVKASLIGVFILFFIGIITLSLFSSAYSNEQKMNPGEVSEFFNFKTENTYSLGTILKFDLSGKGNYELIILKPSGERISRKGSNDRFSLDLTEEGKYNINFKRGNSKNSYFFLVESETEISDESSKPIIKGKLIQEKAEINKPVSWKKRLNESLFEIPDVTNLTLTNEEGESFLDYDLKTIEGKNYIQINGELSENIDLEYFTEAPKSEEKLISENVKEVIVSSSEDVHYEDVLAYTTISEKLSVGQENLIKIYWKENDAYLNFQAYDTNGNNLIDRIEWIIPHLSNQTFEIILITKAEHLNSERIFISDIYEDVKELDDVWSEEIQDENYVRVVFEVPLDNKKDITIFPRIVSGNPIVEVYEFNSNTKIAEFNPLTSNEYNKIYLTNLISESQDTFDLKIIGGSVQFDYIVDPYQRISEGFGSSTTWTVPSGITEITVEAWGAGGAGGGAGGGGSAAGGGGGGGAYARRNITVSPGQQFTITVAPAATGVSNANGNSGESSRLSNATATYVQAAGGTGGSRGGSGAGGAGGTIAGSIGDVRYAGGAGSAGVAASYGGAGGGGAGSTGTGGSASGSTAGTGTSELGGDGANALVGTGNGNIGSIYGGGGGGARKTGGATSVAGGSSAPGYVRISYDEFIPIVINVTSPLNNTYRSSTIWFNATANDNIHTWIINYNGTNITLPNINTSLQLANGSYNLIVYGNDSRGKWGVNNSISFSVDLTPPKVNVLSPEQDKYYGNSLIWFNITTNIWAVANYTIDGGSTNYTLTPNGTNTGFSGSRSLSDGENTVKFYVWDEYGNLNDSMEVDFEVDTTFPKIEFVNDIGGITGTPLNNANFSRNWIFVNVSVDEINEANITFNLYDSNYLSINSSTYTDLRRTINWTGLSDGVYHYNVSVSDVVVNVNSTETRNIQLDTTGPVINIVDPKPILYNINTSLPLNYNIYDSGVGTLSHCWWNLNNGANNSITCGQNTTFNIDEEGENTIWFFSNDTLGNPSSSKVDFFVDTNVPSIELNSPEDDDFLDYNLIDFSYTPEDKRGIDACILYGNWGGWEEKIFDYEVENVSLNYFNNIDLSSYGDGDYLWNVWCNNSIGSYSFAIANFSFTIDTTFPKIEFVNDISGITGTPQNNSNFSRNWIFVNVSVDEINEANMTFSLFNSLGNPINATTYTNPVRTINWTGLSDGVYYYNVSVYDSVNKLNYTETRKIRLDTNGPVINITLPENIIYNYSISLPLNYTVYDEGIGTLYECWWNLNDGINNSIGCGQNTTFNALEGDNKINLYSNDTLGNLNKESIEFIVDLTPPSWTEQNQTRNNVYTDRFYAEDYLNLSTKWEDEFLLENAWLSTNETGIWENKTTYNSPQELSGAKDLSSFIWQNNSLEVGNIISWKIYANDSVGWENFTNEISFRIWGYSEIGDAFFIPKGVKVGYNSTFYCSVLNNYTQQKISGYNVSFYEGGEYLGSNLTDSEGYAQFLISENNEVGSKEITCNISEDASKYYSSSENNEKSVVLGIGYASKVYNYLFPNNHKIYVGTEDYPTTEDSNEYLVESPNGVYLRYSAPTTGTYANQRFEFKIDETTNEITYINLTWKGRGDVGSGTDGYILYIYNHTSGSWIQIASHTTNADRTESFAYTAVNFTDYINSSGYLQFRVRSQRTRPGSPPASAWVYIETDYIQLEVHSDIIPPTVTLNYPDNLKTNKLLADFSCYIQEDYKIANVSLYGNWTGGNWHLNETNSSGVNQVNYTFSKTMSEQGFFEWNCYACDFAGNCDFAAFNKSFLIDTTPPVVNLIYPENVSNFSGYLIDYFNYSVNDLNEIANCSLYGDFNGTWLKNQTVFFPQKNLNSNFSSLHTIGDGYYNWNVLCFDESGNFAFNSTNHTFSSFLPVEGLNTSEFTTYLTANDGTGDVFLSWNSSIHADKYKIYSTDNLLSPFTFLGETSELNYTDFEANQTRKKFYKISSWNPISENISEEIIGKTVYYLKRKENINTRNWIGVYFENNLTQADDALSEINNITSFNMWNSTIQKRVTCNTFSCPEFPSCTDTNCNFDLVPGTGYEVNLNLSSPVFTNWSTIGVIEPSATLQLVKNYTSFSKNWISLYYNSSLTNAQELFSSIPCASTLTDWDEFNQTSKGYIPSPVPWIPAIGYNFILEPEKGYEVSVTENCYYTQT